MHVTAPQIYLLYSLGSVDILTGFLPVDLVGTDYLRRVSQGLHRVHLPAGSTQGEPNGYRCGCCCVRGCTLLSLLTLLTVGNGLLRCVYLAAASLQRCVSQLSFVSGGASFVGAKIGLRTNTDRR